MQIVWSLRPRNWPDKQWHLLGATPDGAGGYRAVIPPSDDPMDLGDHWYVVAVDDRPVCVSS